ATAGVERQWESGAFPELQAPSQDDHRFAWAPPARVAEAFPPRASPSHGSTPASRLRQQRTPGSASSGVAGRFRGRGGRRPHGTQTPIARIPSREGALRGQGGCVEDLPACAGRQGRGLRRRPGTFCLAQALLGRRAASTGPLEPYISATFRCGLS
ncbi:unnamed protein product, partial [Symbiodinium sp. KB8]